MPTTSNFGWTTPADTDYVKDGALAIRTLGNGIDTSLVDLKGGTTGQILSKASNSDLDYVWIANDQGDITAVNVSSPITGGGTAGSVTISIQDATTGQKGAVQLENSTSSTSTTTAAVPASVKSAYDLADAAIPKSLVDAKGDLIVATADNTPARLAVGSTNGHILTVDSSTASGLKWAAAAGGGKVLQVVAATNNTLATSTSSTFADTGLTATITPTLSSSKILVMVHQNGCGKGSSDTFMGVRLFRGATNISELVRDGGADSDTNDNFFGSVSTAYLDDPATTSATTYKTQFNSGGNSSAVYVQSSLSGIAAMSTIVLMEIGV